MREEKNVAKPGTPAGFSSLCQRTGLSAVREPDCGLLQPLSTEEAAKRGRPEAGSRAQACTEEGEKRPLSKPQHCKSGCWPCWHSDHHHHYMLSSWASLGAWGITALSHAHSAWRQQGVKMKPGAARRPSRPALGEVPRAKTKMQGTILRPTSSLSPKAR